jgi:hypothetical protein
MLIGWTQTRDLAPLPKQSFREWWSERQTTGKKPSSALSLFRNG